MGWISGAAILLCACAQPATRSSAPDGDPPADLLLRGGLVIDGSGTPGRRADVAIAGGRIVALGPELSLPAAEELDARGLVIAPGFIDVHTHVEDITAFPLAENYARQGVTTVVSGNCGSSAVAVGEALAEIEREGIAINYSTLVGHNTVRREVMGAVDRPPSAEELERMARLVARAVEEGALGFSTGLQYVPGTYAETAEIVALARAAAEAEPASVYASHMRNEGTEIEAAIEEALAVGRESGCRVQISHLKIDSQSRWGASEVALELLDGAAREGMAVAADQYAYTAGSSGIGIRFPAWALEGGIDAIRTRLEDPEQWARIRAEMEELLAERGFADLSWAVVASYGPKPEWEGRDLAEIAAAERGSDGVDQQLEIARELLRSGGASMVYHFMSEQDVQRFMRHPLVGVASDGSVGEFGAGVPHPRMYGNNPRVLGTYVRERGVIPLEEAVRKMSSLLAEQFGLEGRGRIEVGAWADLVLFDPERVGSPADFAQPHAYPEGVPHVLVGGRFVVRNGQTTGERPGAVLRRQDTQRP